MWSLKFDSVLCGRAFCSCLASRLLIFVSCVNSNILLSLYSWIVIRGVSIGGKGSTEYVVKGSHRIVPHELINDLKAICGVLFAWIPFTWINACRNVIIDGWIYLVCCMSLRAISSFGSMFCLWALLTIILALNVHLYRNYSSNLHKTVILGVLTCLPRNHVTCFIYEKDCNPMHSHLLTRWWLLRYILLVAPYFQGTILHCNFMSNYSI